MNDSSEGALVTAHFKKDDLRSFFHLLVGKPDSTLKVFSDTFELNLTAIKSLNNRVIEKLRNHNVDAGSTSAIISFDDKTIKEFASLDEIFEHQWIGAEKTEDVTLKWDFLVSIPQFKVPQRHTLTFRAGRGPRPREMLAILFSDDEGPSVPDLTEVPAYCRVDFINPTIGKELVNLVSEWYAGLKRPLIVSKKLKELHEYRNAIGETIRLSVPVAFGFLSVGVFRWLMSAVDPSMPVTAGLLEKFGLWMASAAGIVFLGVMLGKVLARKAVWSA